MEKLRIIFMGTPDFAVGILDQIYKTGYDIAAVITAPDKPAGRGQKVAISAVKAYALEKGLPILQPTNLKNEAFLNELASYQANLQIVVAFRMLPEAVWKMPKYGTFNLHASLLPQYRGAAPINWAIINGETQTGVTTFFLQHEIDTGHIIFQEEIAIAPSETAGTLYVKLMYLGAQVLRKTIDAVAANSYPAIAQAHIIDAPKAPKIFKPDCEINFNYTAEELHNFVRGLSPYPAAFYHFKGKIMKVFLSEIELQEHQHLPGEIFSDEKTYLKVACANGFLHLLEVQVEGKKKMDIAMFLRGFTMN